MLFVDYSFPFNTIIPSHLFKETRHIQEVRKRNHTHTAPMQMCLEEADLLTTWCHINNLSPNVTKLEMIIDIGESRRWTSTPDDQQPQWRRWAASDILSPSHRTEDLTQLDKGTSASLSLTKPDRIKVSHRALLKAFYTEESLLTGFRGTTGQD